MKKRGLNIRDLALKVMLDRITTKTGISYKLEYRFHPTRRWRFDAALPSLKLAIEVEGGVWIQGRHNRAGGFVRDMEKYNAAAGLGWYVLRYLPKDIDDGMALISVLAHIRVMAAGRIDTLQ